MALTPEQQIIFDAVLSSLRTNSKTIEQLTPQTSLGPNDWFELNGGRKVSYAVLSDIIASLSSKEIDLLKLSLDKTKKSFDFLYRTLDRYYTGDVEVAAAADGGYKLVLHQHDPVDDSTEDTEVALPLAGLPVEVASEEAMAALIASGNAVAGQLYFIAEEE